MLVVAAFDWRIALGLLALAAARWSSSRSWLGRPLRVGFRARARDERRAHLAHPGDAGRHPRDQGVRRRGLRAAPLRGRQRRRLRRGLRRARALRPAHHRAVLGDGDRLRARHRRRRAAHRRAASRCTRSAPPASRPGRSACSTTSSSASATAPARCGALFRTWGAAQDVTIGLDRVFELLDLEPEVQRRAGRDPAGAAPAQRALRGRALPLPARPPRARGRRLRGARRQRGRDRGRRPARARPR